MTPIKLECDGWILEQAPSLVCFILHSYLTEIRDVPDPIRHVDVFKIPLPTGLLGLSRREKREWLRLFWQPVSSTGIGSMDYLVRVGVIDLYEHIQWM